MMNKHRKKSKILLDYSNNLLIKITFGLGLFFMFIPIIAIIIFSFNDSKRIYIWRGFTFNNYVKAVLDIGLIEALLNSLTIAFFATIFSIILGSLSAYLLWRFNFKLKTVYESALGLPIVIPEIVMGISMLIFFNRIFGSISIGGVWPFKLVLITIAHITFCFPFVSLIISSRLKLFNVEQLEAALDLGASEIRAFLNIVIPYLKPAIISGGLLAFTLSLDDFLITFFTSGPDTVTFPIKIYSMLRFSVTPVVNAASTILIIITIILTLIGIKIQKKSSLNDIRQ